MASRRQRHIAVCLCDIAYRTVLVLTVPPAEGYVITRQLLCLLQDWGR